MSRTRKGLKNSGVALSYYIFNMVLGFISRKVFIDHLGASILGLNTTAQDILGFLNLAELGVGSAIAFTLYKPLAMNDRQAINEIVAVQGWLYRKIASFVGVGALVIMLFFPLIFKKIELPIWYAYASFIALLYSALLSYFVNYRQILLSANQMEYKITYSYKSVLLLKTLFQIIAICYFSNGYIWWLVIQVIFSTLASLSLNHTIRKEYPYLKKNLDDGKYLKKKYSIIIEKVKQLFVHKIAGFTLTQTSSLIIYGYTTLSMVAIYGNYMLIINSINMMFQSIFSGVTAGIGNLVAEGDKKKILSIFEELFSSRFFCVSILCYCILKLSNPFITIWIGSEYLLQKPTLYVIVGIMYINLTRTTIDAYISAYGLFSDVWAPVLEAIVNISLSILLGYYWGITGIVSGVLISLILVVFLWKPYFVFRKALKISIIVYVKMYLKHIMAFVISYAITVFLISFFSIHADRNFLHWIISAIVNMSIFGIVLLLLLYILTSGMRDFTCRIIRIVQKKY